jgi:hypothetical protein
VRKDSDITFSEVLLTSSDGAVQVGTPIVSGVTVSARIVEHGKEKKILVFKRNGVKTTAANVDTASILPQCKSNPLIWEDKPWLIKKDKDRPGTVGIVRASGAALKFSLVSLPEQVILSFGKSGPEFTQELTLGWGGISPSFLKSKGSFAMSV